MGDFRPLIAALLCLISASGGVARAETDWSPYIVDELAREGVQGASVVVIRDYKIVWSKGFGIANALTGERVDADTAFAAASNGKPIVAWLAVQMAARGEIDLDKPVFGLPGVVLPDTAEHRRITPRHLLTHSSGLGNYLRDRERAVSFAPGTQFDYSGVGFMVLQELIEGKTGKPIEVLSRERLLVPLGMTCTWYETPTAAATSIAPPHIQLWFALLPFSLVVGGVFILVCVAVLLQGRLWRGTWRLGYGGWVAAAIGVAAAVIVLHREIGSWPLTLWFTGVPLAVYATTVIVAVIAARSLGPDRVTRGGIVTLVLLLAIAGVVIEGERRLPLPVQTGPANAASSLYASAPDLAAFMIELARPRLADVHATEKMTTAQQRIDGIAAWGLGIGVETHARGRDLWQWGSNPGAKSLMIISPEIGDGVVILTNGESDGALTRRIASRILGRDGCWRAGCAAR